MVPLATVIVFAKVLVPGTVKTRLAARLGCDAATRLARAFLLDTWEALTPVAAARPVLALTGSGPLPRLVPTPEIWDQGSGDLGDRMERALHRATRGGTPAVVIGTDAPGRPPALLDAAIESLHAGTPAVLGPTTDGGYHLIGVARTVPGLLRRLPLGSHTTLATTRARLTRFGMAPRLLAPWYDVDEPEDVARLAIDLRRGAIHAPHTARALHSLGLTRPVEP